jgi:hypothetical protein
MEGQGGLDYGKTRLVQHAPQQVVGGRFIIKSDAAPDVTYIVLGSRAEPGLSHGVRLSVQQAGSRRLWYGLRRWPCRRHRRV